MNEIQHYQSADRSYLEEGVRLLELSQPAPKLFEKIRCTKASIAEFSTFELELEGWRAQSELSTTV